MGALRAAQRMRKGTPERNKERAFDSLFREYDKDMDGKLNRCAFLVLNT
eukprot:COSAG05_NODE_3814_length_1825_cov_2.394554_2_plen_49_part_00